MALKRQRPPHPGPVAECRGLDSNTWRVCLRCWSIDDSNPCSAQDLVDTLRQDRSNSIVCPVYWPEKVVKSWVKSRLPFFPETMFPLKTVESYREISFDKMEQTSSLIHKGRVVEVMLLHPARSRRIKLHFHHRNFFGEAAVWLQLQHPHILPLFGVVADMPPLFVIMYPAGGTCLDYLQANASADRLKLARDVADGLQYLHSRAPPVVHGDVRGRSVVVSGSGDALLWNFDFGPLADPVEGFDRSDFIRPTQNRWASPERLMFGQWCPESDVWSFGMFIWELYSGKPPFPDQTGTRIYDTIYYNGLPERPDHEQLDDDIWDIITACWQRQVAARPRAHDIYQRILSTLARTAALRSEE
ncbi:kinase-like protein [Exidia glandulosa HHB12029]|uniref:Kinase-like protein n=1 Tax=Exidia glandulosa HHB12029 TaxID=1314781 RepID=A0A165FBA9_EXIGL|nr:kinase-like protein [Exidia glandulosa HHB12029]